MTTPASSRLLELPDVSGARAASERDLCDLQEQIAVVRRQVDAAFAVVSGELARRSKGVDGYAGLAQRTGDRTPERLISRLTGLSATESRAMVTAGEALDAVESGDAPWLTPLTDRLASGDVSVSAVASIRVGLGEPSETISLQDLGVAAERLAAEAEMLPPEKMAQRARQARDELDAAGVIDREKALREKRFLRLIPLDDGMTRIVGLLDPESAALVTDAFDRVTSPRRGGVRFVDPLEKARAAQIVADERTTEQLTLDAFVHMVRLATEVDEGGLFGRVAPTVRVHVRLSDLQRGQGVAYAEGQSAGLSLATVHRIACVGGVIPILFDDDGHAMNVGRSQRTHTQRQREAIKARDGGCLIDGCDRPPSWTEIHHPEEWDADVGETSVENGVCLCKFHHMWLHDTGGKIRLEQGRYWLHDGPTGRRTELFSKSPLRRAS